MFLVRWDRREIFVEGFDSRTEAAAILHLEVGESTGFVHHPTRDPRKLSLHADTPCCHGSAARPTTVASSQVLLWILCLPRWGVCLLHDKEHHSFHWCGSQFLELEYGFQLALALHHFTIFTSDFLPWGLEALAFRCESNSLVEFI